MVYGFFHGGDPREFRPDVESCSEREISAHRKACELFDAAERAGQPLPGLECESGWETLPDGTVRHVLKSSFGIGTYQMDVPETEEEWNAVMGDEEDSGSYLWERCYACGHRLAFASDSCPQCGIHFKDGDDPPNWPETCDCPRCTEARHAEG